MDVAMVDPGGLGMAGRGDGVREPDEVAAMVRLKSLGWGIRRIASELGGSPITVRRYLAAGGWVPYRAPERASVLDGLPWRSTSWRTPFAASVIAVSRISVSCRHHGEPHPGVQCGV